MAAAPNNKAIVSPDLILWAPIRLILIRGGGRRGPPGLKPRPTAPPALSGGGEKRREGAGQGGVRRVVLDVLEQEPALLVRDGGAGLDARHHAERLELAQLADGVLIYA